MAGDQRMTLSPGSRWSRTSAVPRDGQPALIAEPPPHDLSVPPPIGTLRTVFCFQVGKNGERLSWKCSAGTLPWRAGHAWCLLDCASRTKLCYRIRLRSAGCVANGRYRFRTRRSSKGSLRDSTATALRAAVTVANPLTLPEYFAVIRRLDAVQPNHIWPSPSRKKVTFAVPSPAHVFSAPPPSTTGPKTRSTGFSSNACHNCGLPGHFAQDCPRLRPGNEVAGSSETARITE